jgi:hypothetical protein
MAVAKHAGPFLKYCMGWIKVQLILIGTLVTMFFKSTTEIFSSLFCKYQTRLDHSKISTTSLSRTALCIMLFRKMALSIKGSQHK